MGLGGRLFGGPSVDPPPGFDTDLYALGREEVRIDIDAKEYHCMRIASPDGSKAVAYGRATGADASRLFAFDDGDILFHTRIDRPVAATIANTGRIAVIQGGSSNTLESTLLVYEESGTELFTHTFPVNAEDCLLLPTGARAIVATRPPTAGLHLFHLESGELIATHEENGTVLRLIGCTRGPDHTIYVREEQRSGPFFGISDTGEITWKSERYLETESFVTRLRKRVTRTQ